MLSYVAHVCISSCILYSTAPDIVRSKQCVDPIQCVFAQNPKIRTISINYYCYGVINRITTIGILWPSEIVRIPDIVRFWPIDGIRTISGPLSVSRITLFSTDLLLVMIVSIGIGSVVVSVMVPHPSVLVQIMLIWQGETCMQGSTCSRQVRRPGRGE